MDNPTGAQDARKLISFNGVDFLTGKPLAPALTAEELVRIALAEHERTPDERHEANRNLFEARTSPTLGFEQDVDIFEEARWGVVIAPGESGAVLTALEPLVRRRGQQTRSQPPLLTYQPGWTADEFLSHYGAARGFGDTSRVPYYLLLVGGPEKIPFRLQYELGGEYGVGRLAFEEAAGYQAYVERLIDYETARHVPTRREAAFWATANRDPSGQKEDEATRISSSILALGLFDGLSPSLRAEKSILLGQAATKERLAGLFCRDAPPALVFTASHGLGYREITPAQPRYQGALVTQEWLTDTPFTQNDIFSAQDLDSLPGRNLHGLVHFAFACFSAGTPETGEYEYGQLPIQAERPFVARLPVQELANGALGVFGHIDRAWAFSFLDVQDRPMLAGYQRALRRILQGQPLGHALRDLHDRAAQLSLDLIKDLSDAAAGKQFAPAGLASRWCERNDACAYALLGDPGARVRI